jgi:hypothetical protein
MLPLTGPICIELSKMTATVIIYTGQGFAVAADGLELWEDPDTHRRSLRPGGDRVQKIFAAERKDATLAYILRGQVASEDRAFDLEEELRKQLSLFTATKFNNYADFLRLLASALENAIKCARQDKRLKEPLEAWISFAGYFGTHPCLVDLKFLPHPHFTNSLYEFNEPPLRHRRPMVSGPPIIWDLISERDPRFAQYFVQYDKPVRSMSLREAADYAKGCIDAFSSPLARQLDPSCEAIGGHVHVATVTPDNGFQWVIGPLVSGPIMRPPVGP